MSKAKRFWLTMGLGLVAVIPLRLWLEAVYPVADKLLVLVSGLVVSYFALRYLYEHWDE